MHPQTNASNEGRGLGTTILGLGLLAAILVSVYRGSEARHSLVEPAESVAQAPTPPPVPVPPTPAKPTIHLPVYPPPTPPPTPGPIPLNAGQMYVFGGTADIPVISSPAGILNIIQSKGPLTVPEACLVDNCGSGKPRIFSDPYVWMVTPAATGTAELIIWQLDANGNPIRVQISANNGPAPPGPVPPGPVDPLTAVFQVAYTTDTDPDRAKSLAFLMSSFKGMAAAVPTRTDLKTTADADSWGRSVVTAAGVGLTPTQLVNTRKAITAELMLALGMPSATAPLDLSKFAVELSRIAASLSGVK